MIQVVLRSALSALNIIGIIAGQHLAQVATNEQYATCKAWEKVFPCGEADITIVLQLRYSYDKYNVCLQ